MQNNNGSSTGFFEKVNPAPVAGGNRLDEDREFVARGKKKRTREVIDLVEDDGHSADDERSLAEEKRGKSSRSQPAAVKQWCMTIYPHKFDSVEQLKACCDAIGAASSYAMFGRETCPKTGKRHLQAFCLFKDRVRTTQLKKMYHKSIHWEPMNGSIEDSERYCSKDDTAPLVYGEKPKTAGELEQDRWRATREACKRGDLDAVDDQIFVTQFSNIQKIANHYAPSHPSLDAPCGVWLYGVPGSGKTHWATTKYGAFYYKLCNKWWDGYKGEETVLIDDIDPSHVYMGQFLKHWADKYAFRGETKGGGGMYRPKTVIVTSNYSIEECFPDMQGLKAFKRRFKVWYFPYPYKEGMKSPIARELLEDESPPLAEQPTLVLPPLALKRSPPVVDLTQTDDEEDEKGIPNPSFSAGARTPRPRHLK